jgi:DNA-binding transcriptional regulator of glucitol operon
MDADYKKMMTWVLIVLVGSVLAAIAIVEWVVRHFGEGG